MYMLTTKRLKPVLESFILAYIADADSIVIKICENLISLIQYINYNF